MWSKRAVQLRFMGASDRAARIEQIAEMIRRLQFKYGETYKALAREWDVTYQYVRDLGAEAFRVVQEEIAEPDAVTTSVCVHLEDALREAHKAKDFRAISDLGNTWVKLAYQHRDHTARGKVALGGTRAEQAALFRSVAEALESQEGE
jgi:hypothetical protein